MSGLGDYGDFNVHLYWHFTNANQKDNCNKLNQFLSGLLKRNPYLHFTILIPENVEKHLQIHENIHYIQSLDTFNSKFDLIHHTKVDYNNDIHRFRQPPLYWNKVHTDFVLSFHPLRTYDLWRRYRTLTPYNQVQIGNVFEKRMVNRILRNDLGYNLGDYYDGGFYEGENTFNKVSNNHLKCVKTTNNNPYIYKTSNSSVFDKWFKMKIDMMLQEFPMKKITPPYKKMKKSIKSEGEVSSYKLQKLFGWGMGIQITVYRYKLRLDKNIRVGFNSYRWVS